LRSLWPARSDPESAASERAFSYARVLENPTCRWSTYLCNAQGIDCSNPGAVPSGYGECCNPAAPRTIRERAWSSPIWYLPGGVAPRRATIRLGDQPQQDTLRLAIDL